MLPLACCNSVAVNTLIAELTAHATHQAKKIWTYDHTTVQPCVLLACAANCTTGTSTPQLSRHVGKKM